MGQVENLPENPGLEDARAARELLRTVTQELESLQQNLLVQLNQDVKRLQAEKYRLEEEIADLQTRSQQLKSQQLDSTFLSSNSSQHHATQELAQTIAIHLQELLQERLAHLATQPYPTFNTDGNHLAPTTGAEEHHQNAHRLLASLDSSIRMTIQTLQQDLSSYQSSLSQQLSRMYDLEQQGETILEALVGRLKEQLRKDAIATQPIESPTSVEPQPLALPEEPLPELRQLNSKRSSSPVKTPIKAAPVVNPEAAPKAPAPTKSTSQVTQGIILALLTAVILSLFNVTLKVILKSAQPRLIFGAFELDGLITPGFGNSLLILFLRMVVVMALMPILATVLYPAVWQDIRRFIQSRDRLQILKVVGSGFFLFLSQIFIYLALGNIPAGVAITIFFIYPLVTVLGSWKLFGDRPSLARVMLMGVIALGLILAALPNFGVQAFGNVGVGVGSAIASGITFAGYVLLTQLGTKKLHPIPFTLIAFAAIFVFSAISLMLPFPAALSVQVDPAARTGLLIAGAILGVLTLASYLLNNIAIRYAGAALAAIIGTSGPALTALFALFIIGENIKLVQWSGLALVTLGVLGMSLERMMATKKAT